MATDKAQKIQELIRLPGNRNLRAEVIIAELVRSGLVSLRSSKMLTNGGFHRSIESEVVEAFEDRQVPFNFKGLAIVFNRKGIYDNLPEGLFLQPKIRKHFKTNEEVKEEQGYQKQLEQSARRFFSPLDDILLKTRIQVEMLEREYTSEILSVEEQTKGLSGFWQIPSFFSKEEAARLLMLLPLSYRISSDIEMARRAMETVLDLPITFEEQVDNIALNSEHLLYSKLGGSLLGVDSACNWESGSYDDFKTKVIIGPISKESASSFAPGSRGDMKLSYLSECFIPADFELEYEVELELEQRESKFGDEDSLCLAFTTYLN